MKKSTWSKEGILKFGNFDNLVKLAKEQEEYYAGVDVDEDGFETRRSFDWKW